MIVTRLETKNDSAKRIIILSCFCFFPSPRGLRKKQITEETIDQFDLVPLRTQSEKAASRFARTTSFHSGGLNLGRLSSNA